MTAPGVSSASLSRHSGYFAEECSFPGARRESCVVRAFDAYEAALSAHDRLLAYEETDPGRLARSADILRGAHEDLRQAVNDLRAYPEGR